MANYPYATGILGCFSQTQNLGRPEMWETFRTTVLTGGWPKLYGNSDKKYLEHCKNFLERSFSFKFDFMRVLNPQKLKFDLLKVRKCNMLFKTMIWSGTHSEFFGILCWENLTCISWQIIYWVELSAFFQKHS